MPPMGKGGKAGRNPLALLRGGRSVDDLFLELDGDGSGSIDRDELRVLLQQHAQLIAIDAAAPVTIQLQEQVVHTAPAAQQGQGIAPCLATLAHGWHGVTAPATSSQRNLCDSLFWHNIWRPSPAGC